MNSLPSAPFSLTSTASGIFLCTMQQDHYRLSWFKSRIYLDPIYPGIFLRSFVWMFMFTYCSTFTNQWWKAEALILRCLLFNESAITANSKPITGVLNMYFESILTLNDMPIHKRYTYVEFVKITFCPTVDKRSKGSVCEAG